MATRAVLLPFSAEYPSTNYPACKVDNDTFRPDLAFDAGTNETCYWTFIAPQGWTTPVTAYIFYSMATATTGDVDWDVAVEAITDGDTVDMDSATSWDTVNSTDNTVVPGTAGYLDVVAVTLTNNDSSAAGDYIRISLTRDAVSDTATGDALVYAVEIRDSA